MNWIVHNNGKHNATTEAWKKLYLLEKRTKLKSNFSEIKHLFFFFLDQSVTK